MLAWRWMRSGIRFPGIRLTGGSLARRCTAKCQKPHYNHYYVIEEQPRNGANDAVIGGAVKRIRAHEYECVNPHSTYRASIDNRW